MSVSTAGLGTDLSTREFWMQSSSERASHFTTMRREAPVARCPPPQFGSFPADQEYWAVTRFEDVVHVSRQAELFCSGKGVTLDNLPVELLQMSSAFLIMDAPRHTELRRIVSSAFTPKRVAALEAAIDARARQIVDEFVDAGGGDITQLAAPLPLWTISQMLGMPDDMHAEMWRAVDLLSGGLDVRTQDPEGHMASQMEGAFAIFGMAAELAAARRHKPTGDLVSVLLDGEFEGEPLTDQMIGSIFLLFGFAGNDTSRTAIGHGVRLFAENPDQWNVLRADVEGAIRPAVEEIFRCATPVIQFRRTASGSIELNGQAITEDDQVVLFYESANQDETEFAHPERFEIRRDPNHQVAFGGGGPHFCLGANLARTELRAVFRHLARRCTRIEVSQPEFLASSFINGIVHMDVGIG